MNESQALRAASITPLTIVNRILRRSWFVIGVAAVFGVGAAIYAIFSATYVADARFRPHVADASGSRLSSLAAQFGFSIGTVSGGESVQFYAQLLHSRDLLRAAVRTVYEVSFQDGGSARRGTLVELYEIDADTPEQKERAAIKRLDENLFVTSDLEAGLVSFQVRAFSPLLAVGIARRLLDLLNEFNLERRQSQAAAERKFAEERLASSRDELTEAEADLQEFLTNNRSYQESPRLAFEADRLQRRVSLLQNVQTTLATAYEQARIDEVRDTPVITIVDAPEGSARTAASLMRRGVLGFVGGAIVAVGIVLLGLYREHMEARRDPEFTELMELAQRVRGVLRLKRER